MFKSTFKTLTLITALTVGTAAQAQDTTVQGVITDQLQAFNDRDIAGAWEHASPMIQRMFGTPDNFASMVRNGYPMVWDNSNVRFLDQEVFDTRTRQEVMITGPDGLFYILDYQMIATPDGWQINGVQVIPAPDIFS